MNLIVHDIDIKRLSLKVTKEIKLDEFSASKEMAKKFQR